MQLKIIFQLVLCAVCVPVSAQTDLIPFRKGNLWGFSKPDKTIVIACQYDEVGFFENHKALIRKGLKYGLVNDAGKEIVPCQYDEIGLFENHKALIRKGLLYGLMSDTGKEIVPCQYYNPIKFNEGLAKVAKDTCEVTGALKVMDSLSIKHGSSRMTKSKLCNYGFINEQGKIVIPCIYPEASDFHNGYAFVMVSGGHYELNPVGFYRFQEPYYVGNSGFIDKKGIPIGGFNVITTVLDGFPRFKNGIAFVLNGGKWGIIDTQNRIIKPFIYDNLSFNYDETCRIFLHKKVGLVSKFGQEIVPPLYDDVLRYNFGVVIYVHKGEKYGLYDSLGNVLLPCVYERGFSFNEGLGSIFQNKKYGFINEKGKIVIPFRYDAVSAFEKGRAWVELNQNRFQIDTLGHYVGESNQQYWVMHRNGGYQIEDKTGKILLPADTQRIDIVKENFAIVVKNNLWRLFDIKKQKFILPRTAAGIFVQEIEKVKDWVFGVHQNSFLGLFNSEGKQIAACEYDKDSPIIIDSIHPFVTISKNKKFGCLSIHTGKIMISFSYDKPFSWIKGQSVAQKNGNMGIIDTKERVILPFEYKFPDEEPLFYTEGLAPIYKNRKMGFMDSSFRVKIPFEYEEPYETVCFQNGIAPVSKPDSFAFGFINRQNKEIVLLQYADAHGMQEGRACIHTDTHTQFIDSLGKPLTDWIQGNASPYRNQVSILKIAKDTQVLLNLQGKPISKKYHHIELLNDSLLLVQNGQFGLIDLHGKEIIPTIYEKIDTCNALFYSASKGGKHGFVVKKTQKFVISDDIPKVLNRCYILRTGHEAFEENWGLIDSLGQTLIPMQRAWITTLANHFMFFSYKDKVRLTHLIDKHGKTLLEGEYDFPHTDNSGFYVVKSKENKMGLLNLETFEWIFPCVYENIHYIKKDLYKIVNKAITYYAKNNKTIYYEN